MGTATGTQAAGGAAAGTFRVKISQLGKEGVKLWDVTAGQTAGQVARAAGYDLAEKQIRVNGTTVNEDYVVQPTDGVIVLAQRIAAGA